jgi:hypothetical protein
MLSPALISSTWSPHPYGQLFSMVIYMDMKRRISSINNDNYWEQFGNIREKNEEGERGREGILFGLEGQRPLGITLVTLQKKIIVPLYTLEEIS